MAERPKTAPGSGHLYKVARWYLQEFLRLRATPSRELRRMPRYDLDGAYPQAGEPGVPGAKRHEMVGAFVPDALDRVVNPSDRSDLVPYPDWCWTGWERELAILQPEHTTAILRYWVERRSLREAAEMLGVSTDTVTRREREGLRILATTLLNINMPRPRF